MRNSSNLFAKIDHLFTRFVRVLRGFFFRDLTNLQSLKLEKEIREKFVSTLAHDLRNTLNVAKVGSQLLTEAQTTEERAQFASMVIRSVNRADQMIQNLLDANRIKAGQKLPIQVEFIEIISLIKEAIVDLTYVYGNRFVLTGEQKVLGYWCPMSIRRIVENLAGNAAKYGLRDTPIKISVTTKNKKVYIAVHNEGEALSQQELATIFEPFKRLGSAQKSGFQGWGLGLTLVRAIIESHGGTISIQSERNKETIFTAELPLDARPYQG